MLTLKHVGSGEIFYATTDSAGFDICANEGKVIPKHNWSLVRTGLFITEDAGPQTVKIGEHTVRLIPELQLRPRSGLSAKHGITILNAPSTIDADYRGEILVNLINHSETDFEVKPGDRIAQAICALVMQIPGIRVNGIERGTGGFGSTGT